MEKKPSLSVTHTAPDIGEEATFEVFMEPKTFGKNVLWGGKTVMDSKLFGKKIFSISPFSHDSQVAKYDLVNDAFDWWKKQVQLRKEELRQTRH